MPLSPARIDDLETLMQWFGDARSAYQWGGPMLRFPFSAATFREDAHWGAMASLVMRDDDGLLAFGQYYEKLGRCHLARLAVNPKSRGKGVGTRFIAELLAHGLSDLQLSDASLFVAKDNAGAIRCYRKLGFEDAPWPSDQPTMPGIVFMVLESG